MLNLPKLQPHVQHTLLSGPSFLLTLFWLMICIAPRARRLVVVSLSFVLLLYTFDVQAASFHIPKAGHSLLSKCRFSFSIQFPPCSPASKRSTRFSMLRRSLNRDQPTSQTSAPCFNFGSDTQAFAPTPTPVSGAPRADRYPAGATLCRSLSINLSLEKRHVLVSRCVISNFQASGFPQTSSQGREKKIGSSFVTAYFPLLQSLRSQPPPYTVHWSDDFSYLT
jgi:hypothetical protein